MSLDLLLLVTTDARVGGAPGCTQPCDVDQIETPTQRIQRELDPPSLSSHLR